MYQLSVIVPVTNMFGRLGALASWIPVALASRIQVIIIHDKRDEDTGIELEQLVRSYGSKDIVFIETRAGSAGIARNVGKKYATAEWIAFWDSDDIPDPESAIRILSSASPEVDAICGQYLRIDGNLSCGKSLTFSKLDLALNPGMWRVIFRKSLIEGLNFTEFKMGEDQAFMLESKIYESHVSFSYECIYSYVTGVSTQATRNKKSIDDLTRCINYIKNLNNSKTLYGQVIKSKLILTLLRKGSARRRIFALIQISLSPLSIAKTIMFIRKGRKLNA